MNRAALVLGLATVALLQGCESSEERLNKKLIESAKPIVSRDFLDPSAAQFRDMRFDVTKRLYCGEVNRKNALGAYVGFTRFRLIAGANDDGSFMTQSPRVVFDRPSPHQLASNPLAYPNLEAYRAASKLAGDWNVEQSLLQDCQQLTISK